MNRLPLLLSGLGHFVVLGLLILFASTMPLRLDAPTEGINVAMSWLPAAAEPTQPSQPQTAEPVASPPEIVRPVQAASEQSAVSEPETGGRPFGDCL